MELSGTINRSITLSGSMIARGLDGRGIVSIAKTGTSGLVDTYTITYTDATTSTFTVTNGANGQITATSFAEEFSSSKAYAAGDYVVYSGQLYQFTPLTPLVHGTQATRPLSRLLIRLVS